MFLNLILNTIKDSDLWRENCTSSRIVVEKFSFSDSDVATSLMQLITLSILYSWNFLVCALSIWFAIHFCGLLFDRHCHRYSTYESFKKEDLNSVSMAVFYPKRNVSIDFRICYDPVSYRSLIDQVCHHLLGRLATNFIFCLKIQLDKNKIYFNSIVSS